MSRAERSQTAGSLTLSGVFLSFGGKPVLSDVSFEVPKGRMFCLVGRNGAGKSCLFKCIAGLITGFTGNITVGGLSLRDMRGRERARQIAYVPQSSPDDIPYSVREFVEMSRYPWEGMSAKSSNERAVDEAMEMTGISGLSSRRMSELSGGERQKVMIASAIAQESGIILMDEPTTYLDYAHQAEAAELIRDVLEKRGTTILLVTHDLNLALDTADCIIALKSGKVEWAGPPGEFAAYGGLSGIFGVEFERFVPDGGVSRGAGRVVLIPRRSYKNHPKRRDAR